MHLCPRAPGKKWHALRTLYGATLGPLWPVALGIRQLQCPSGMAFFPGTLEQRLTLYPGIAWKESMMTDVARG